MPSKPTKVLIADDQELVRSGFSMILSVVENIEVVGQAHNGKQAVSLVEQLQPDIVLMDIQMPELDGINATELIKKHYPRINVLILTTFDREDYLFAALRAGASGFLLKNVDSAELVSAIEKIASGFALLSPEMTVPLIRRWVDQGAGHGSTSDISDDDNMRLESLTARERETLALMAEGLTNSEIADRLYVGTATVKTHVSNILSKTHCRDRVAAVIFAYRLGIVGE